MNVKRQKGDKKEGTWTEITRDRKGEMNYRMVPDFGLIASTRRRRLLAGSDTNPRGQDRKIGGDRKAGRDDGRRKSLSLRLPQEIV